MNEAPKKNLNFALCYDLEIFQKYKLHLNYHCNLSHSPHTLFIGQSGSGKTTAIVVDLYQFYKLKERDDLNVNLYLFDFKNSQDFSFLETSSCNYFTGDECIEGLEKLYVEFQESKKNSNKPTELYTLFIFDEYPAYILYLTNKDKKLAEKHKQYISEILMLGRSMGYIVWMCMQRPDSNFLGNGARDNFHNVIALGRLSQEARQMVFSGFDVPDRIFRIGEGLLLSPDSSLEVITFPRLSNRIRIGIERYIVNHIG